MAESRMVNAIAMGAVAGARSFSAPALVAAELKRRPRALTRGRTSSKAGFVAGALGALALAEMAGDKAPGAGPRTAPASLVARSASGALAGAAMMPRSRALGALLGAGAALAATSATYRLRRFALEKGVPNLLAGLVEDALVLWIGARVATELP